jgi:maltose phosphorylase
VLILKKVIQATFQEVIAGIYYPDKKKVGWWKNGYPNFAKVLNAPNWIGIDIEIKSLDLNTCTAVKTFVATEYEGRLVQSFL